MTIIVVMGVSGSGKTTVGRALAEAIGATFFDADDFHSAENVEKMRRGEPLTEGDRGPWLQALRALIDEWLPPGRIAVLACSALTARSRALLGISRTGVELVFLNGPSELILERMRERRHFMPAALLDSQLAVLEPPANALELDVRRPVGELVEEIRAAWDLR